MSRTVRPERLPRVYHAFFATFGRLRPVQELAIPRVLAGQNLLIVAPTGSGKTEAVVAPLAEMALDHPDSTYALYIAPTRALVNDLAVRLTERLEACGLRLAVRHGERKTVQGRQPPAMIITTPESLEVMLSLQHEYEAARLREVRAVVVDEAHQLYGTARGQQLYYLLERLKHVARRPLQRLCLSATVGDAEVVASFFQGSDAPLDVLEVGGSRRIQVYLDWVAARSPEEMGEAAATWLKGLLEDHRKVLVFANTRVQCDWLCWQLSGRVKKVPIYLHYSSLHREYRETVERAFREGSRAVCIATSTLELGIDIGDIDAVAMWGAPPTVTSFLQRLGRGNRRTDQAVVYAACPEYYPSGAPADPDHHLLSFLALLRCALQGELEVRSQPEYYSVLAQQLLALCCQFGRVAPDAFLKTIACRPPYADLRVLSSILEALAEEGVLEYDARLDLWRPTDVFHRWRVLGKFWSNIPEQAEAVVLRDGQGTLVPLAQLPRQFTAGLRPGDVLVVAGRPRMVLAVDSSSVRVFDLVTSEAALPKYFSPAEPTPRRVAEGIRTVIGMTDAELATLPVGYDARSKQRLRELRSTLQPLLQVQPPVYRDEHGRWVILTFAGTTTNMLLSQWLRYVGTRVVDQDSWRVRCADPPAMDTLIHCTPEALARLVRRDWERYRDAFPRPPLFPSLPESMQEQEVLSALDLDENSETLRRLAASSAPSGLGESRS